MIVGRLNKIEENYKKCLDEIKDDWFDDFQIEECTGLKNLKLSIDIKYIMMRFLSWTENLLRNLFMSLCYQKSNNVEEFRQGCDEIERDVIDLLWLGLNFSSCIETNKDKYLILKGALPKVVYAEIKENMVNEWEYFISVVKEIDTHKDIVINNVKLHIDNRFKYIAEKAKTDPLMFASSSLSHDFDIKKVEIVDSQPTHYFDDVLTDENQDDSRKLKIKSTNNHRLFKFLNKKKLR